MTNQEIKLEKILKGLNTDNLIIKLKETLGDFAKASINIAIQEELEIRIGIVKLDKIIDEC